MKKLSNLTRPEAILLAAFILALTTGIAVDGAWQGIVSRVGNESFDIPQNIYPDRINHVCQVHGELMSRRYVSILAGLPGYPINEADYLAAKERLFPNSNFFIIDRSRSAIKGHEEVNVCSKCRAAERAWMGSRPSNSTTTVEP